jgi:hypothetical protein
MEKIGAQLLLLDTVFRKFSFLLLSASKSLESLVFNLNIRGDFTIRKHILFKPIL